MRPKRKAGEYGLLIYFILTFLIKSSILLSSEEASIEKDEKDKKTNAEKKPSEKSVKKELRLRTPSNLDFDDGAQRPTVKTEFRQIPPSAYETETHKRKVELELNRTIKINDRITDSSKIIFSSNDANIERGVRQNENNKTDSDPSTNRSVADAPKTPTTLAEKTKSALNYLSQSLSNGPLNRGTGSMGVIVTTALTGLAFVAAGGLEEKNPYSAETESCIKRITSWSGADRTDAWDQSTWGLAYSVMFLAEVHARQKSERVERALNLFVTEITHRQTPAGSWCHGRGGPCAAGYRELNGVGIPCLIAIGMAQKCGIKIDQTVVEKGLKYVLDSAHPGGGVGYSIRAGQRGVGDAGRTAAAVWAFNLLGKDKNPLYEKMCDYVRQNFSAIERGHGSPLCHLLNSAFMCKLLGKADWDRFWNTYGTRIQARQKGLGCFTPPNGEDLPSLETDRATATQVLILQLAQDVPIFTGGKDRGIP